MENIFIAIVSENREYSRALSLAMLSICRSFIIKIFNEKEFADRNTEFDLVLWDVRNEQPQGIANLVFLTDKPSDSLRNYEERIFGIYKYSSANYIVTSVFEIYEALTGRHAVNLRRHAVSLYGFISCTGGSGCSTVAMSFAQELCRFQGKRVLYLSFEEIESTGYFMKSHSGIKGVGIYLYHLFKEINLIKNRVAEPVYPFLDAYLIRDDFGIEAFAPSYGRNPLMNLNTDELNLFMSSLIDSGRFDVIVMDIGTCLSKVGISCIEMAEKLCFVGRCEDEGIREEQYISYLLNKCDENILKKAVRVRNCSEDGNEDDDTVHICTYHNMTIEGHVRKLLLEGSFGYEISRLASKITEP